MTEDLADFFDEGWVCNPLAPSPPVAVENTKTSVIHDKQLIDEDWAFLRLHKPDLAWGMLRRAFNLKRDGNYISIPRDWLESRCSGFYYLANMERVLFENEEDAVLFKMTFEGSS